MPVLFTEHLRLLIHRSGYLSWVAAPLLDLLGSTLLAVVVALLPLRSHPLIFEAIPHLYLVTKALH